MKNSIIAVAAGFAASAAAFGTACSGSSCGQAIVVSYCDAPVYLKNTPSGGPDQDQQTLSYGDSYKQTYTALPDDCGWAIKISPTENFDQQIQYEYTYQGGDNPIWYDMSLVNVNGALPFSWEFASSEDSCKPDNSNVFTDPTTPTGMQTQCDVGVSLTLNLCKGSDSGSSSSSSAVSSAAASTVAPSSYSSSAAQSTSAVQSTSSAPVSSAKASSTPASSAASSNPTTLATSTSRGHWTGNEKVAAATTVISSVVTPVAEAGGVVVTETDVEVVTQVATTFVVARDAEATPAAHKRHIHGHPHGSRQ